MISLNSGVHPKIHLHGQIVPERRIVGNGMLKFLLALMLATAALIAGKTNVIAGSRDASTGSISMPVKANDISSNTKQDR